MNRLERLWIIGIGVSTGCWLAGIAGFCLLASASQAQDCQGCVVRAGAITGRVINPSGYPVLGATVYAVKYNFEKGIVPTARTNKKGFFRMILPVGRYIVFAGKESLGYPESRGPMYGDAVNYSDLLVKADEVKSRIVLTLGPRFGRLTLRVMDASTGKPLSSANIALLFQDGRSQSLETGLDNGRFEMLVPPVPVTIKISGRGYEEKQLGPFKISRTETKRIAVSLGRVNPGSGFME